MSIQVEMVSDELVHLTRVSIPSSRKWRRLQRSAFCIELTVMSKSGTETPTWRAPQKHYGAVAPFQLRQLFADDPKRRKRRAPERGLQPASTRISETNSGNRYRIDSSVACNATEGSWRVRSIKAADKIGRLRIHDLVCESSVRKIRQ